MFEYKGFMKLRDLNKTKQANYLTPEERQRQNKRITFVDKDGVECTYYVNDGKHIHERSKEYISKFFRGY